MLASFLIHQPRCRRHVPGVHAGFTLTEALICLAVLALLLTSGITTLGSWLIEVELRNTAYALADAMALARAEAIKHGARATLCKTVDRRTCTNRGGWESGWMLFLDDNRNGNADAGEALVRIEPVAPAGISARGNQPVANYVSFTALGHARLLSGALQMGTFTVCRPGLREYQVVLANTGRVRVDRGAAVCP